MDINTGAESPSQKFITHAGVVFYMCVIWIYKILNWAWDECSQYPVMMASSLSGTPR